MMRKSVLALFVAIMAALPALAQVETRVVLGIEPSTTLTPAFRKSIRESISIELRSSMDGLATHSLIDLADLRPEDRLPNWTAALSQPLNKLSIPTDPMRTHYVNISLVDGKYVVESRWVDGSLGWVSPEVQRDRTPDREGLSRLVLSQLVRDPGVVGLIDTSDGDRAATLHIASNTDGSNLAKWIRVGDLFAVMQSNGDGQYARVPNVLLRAASEPVAGKVACRIESRYVKPLEGWETGKFRAVKLPARHGKVRMHVTANDSNLVEGLSVRISPTGFERAESMKEAGTIRRGEYTSNGSYDRIAFVRLMAGDRVVAQVPMEVLRDATVSVEIRANTTPADVIPPDVDLRLIRSRLQEMLNQVAEDKSQFDRLIEKGQHREALDRVNQIRARLDERLPRLTLELAALRKRSDLAVGLDEAERALRDLVSAQKSLQGVKGSLEKAIAAANSPESERRRAALELQITQADRAVDDADYDKAILIYEEVLREQSNWPEAKRRLDELKQGWKIASDEHRKARTTIYETFANSKGADDISKNIDGARSAFVVCKNVGDRYTPRKLYLALQKAAVILAQRSEELRLVQGVDAQTQREQIRRTSTQASELLTEVENYLRAK